MLHGLLLQVVKNLNNSVLIFRCLILSICLVLGMTSAYSQVEVELICPEDVTINCDEELQPLENYGAAMYIVGDEKNQLENQQSKRSIDDCGKGNIERIWRYKSEEGDEYQCSQFIHIGQNEKGQALIDWPTKEVVVSWCDPSYKPLDLAPAAQEPKYFIGDCTKMEHTYSDEIVYLDGNCKEVHRNWLVHDWCYDSKNIEGNDGHYKFTQVIKFAVPEEVMYGEIDDVYIEAEDCEKVFVELPDMKANIDDCNRRVRVKNDSPFASQNRKNASGTYPVGETLVTYTVVLECTDARKFTQRIIVTDPCKEKAIIANQELEIKLQQSFVRPNPFSQTTEILFQNDDHNEAQLVIRDTSGNEILSSQLTVEKDKRQTIKLSAEEISKPGVYLYSIKIGERTLEGKLIKIR